jgi:CHAD domain-containing protein
MPIFAMITPIDLFQRQIAVLRDKLPGVLEGRSDSVHDARIATRRIRAVLPLTHEWHPRDVVEDRETRFKRTGAALGRVRDADVRIELLRHMESRLPAAAASLLRIRQQQEHDRSQRLRQLVKRLERLDIQEEVGRSATPGIWERSRRWLAARGAWRNEVRRLLDQRAKEAADAITHATSVYFPNRAHRARIALKKFRYAAEIGAQTGAPITRHLLRTLKKGQDALGELRDRQTLIDALRDTDEPRSDDGDESRERRSIIQLAEAEIGDLHRRFVVRRPRLLAATDEARDAMRRSRVPVGALTVAAAVALAGVTAIRRNTQATAGPEPEPGPKRPPNAESTSSSVVAVRIPVPMALGSDR